MLFSRPILQPHERSDQKVKSAQGQETEGVRMAKLIQLVKNENAEKPERRRVRPKFLAQETGD
jgi:hypothetical protein